jgi:AcrR family transcriptional regulator
MRAKSATIAGSTAHSVGMDAAVASGKRLSREARRAQILAQAADYFAEYGLTAHTRGLADACGISQRLLYRVFPTKAALLEEVYRTAILGAFRREWLPPLRDRSVPVRERLCRFYQAYHAGVLTRSWMRLFLYASLAEADMAPNYIGDIVTSLLDTIVEEVAHEQSIALPADKPFLNEVGWTLHGAVSHLAIRRHLYRASRHVPVEHVVELHVTAFVDGFRGMIDSRDNPSRAANAPEPKVVN